ncbi:MAG: hypothetical protein WA977_13500 [Halobacteriota archaeon]
MNKFIELYGEEEDEGTSIISVKEAKEKFFDLEKYPLMVMKAEKIRYKISPD